VARARPKVSKGKPERVHNAFNSLILAGYPIQVTLVIQQREVTFDPHDGRNDSQALPHDLSNQPVIRISQARNSVIRWKMVRHGEEGMSFEGCQANCSATALVAGQRQLAAIIH